MLLILALRADRAGGDRKASSITIHRFCKSTDDLISYVRAGNSDCFGLKCPNAHAPVPALVSHGRVPTAGCHNRAHTAAAVGGKPKLP